jgi:hypothetical protein
MKYRESILDALNMLLDDCVQKISEDQKKGKVKAWHIGLEEITDDQVYMGLKKALSNNNGFLLSCGQFKELCILDEHLYSTEDEAMIAWAEVNKHLNSWSSPIFKNSVISESIRKMGGWKKICARDEKEEPFQKKDFIKIYTTLKKSGREYSRMLKGRGSYVLIGYNEFDGNKNDIIDQVEAEEKQEKKLLSMMAGNEK